MIGIVLVAVLLILAISSLQNTRDVQVDPSALSNETFIAAGTFTNLTQSNIFNGTEVVTYTPTS